MRPPHQPDKYSTLRLRNEKETIQRIEADQWSSVNFTLPSGFYPGFATILVRWGYSEFYPSVLQPFQNKGGKTHGTLLMNRHELQLKTLQGYRETL